MSNAFRRMSKANGVDHVGDGHGAKPTCAVWHLGGMIGERVRMLVVPRQSSRFATACIHNFISIFGHVQPTKACGSFESLPEYQVEVAFVLFGGDIFMAHRRCGCTANTPSLGHREEKIHQPEGAMSCKVKSTFGSQ